MSLGERIFFLTGGTGFLGSHIAVELMKRGNRVIMAVRSRPGRDARSRVQALMKWFDFDPGLQLQVIEADIEQSGLGLDASALKRLNQQVEEVFHCAADTRFSQRMKQAVDRVNRQGLVHVFEGLGDCRHFHYMSTAYVAGKRSGICREELETPPSFHNAYEESKYEAEQIIDGLCRNQGIRLTVYRPSVVYGDSLSGRSFRFNALYYPVRVLWNLRQAFLRDIREKSGRKAKAMGVGLKPHDLLEMPFRIADQGSGVDLIPVDFCCQAVLAIMESGLGGIFHIHNPRLSTLAELIGYIQRFCRISGIRPDPEFKSGDSEGLEKIVDDMMGLYRPYFCDQRIFDHSRSQPLLNEAGLACPVLTYDVFARCMDYAVDTGWGRKLPF